MIRYFIYCRKSSEEEERQVLSLDAQLTELREYAKNNGLVVVREFYESKTAKEPGREIFNLMVEEIEKGNAEGILAWNPDRLARNSIDGGRIIYLVDREKIQALKFPTFWFETTPQGKFMLSVAFGQAKYYTDNLSENIHRGIRQKLRRGEFPSKAPLGYLNDLKTHNIIPDPENFAKMKQILTEFSSGEYTLSKIKEKMFSLGLVGINKHKQLAISTVQRMIANPFYYGHFRYWGELHEGSHPPMISKKLFDLNQIALRDNGKPRKKRFDIGFLFKNLLVCGECGFSVTAERHIKRTGRKFIYYHCTHKSKTHDCKQNRFLREDRLAAQMKEYCQKVSLPDEWRDKYLEKVSEWEKETRVESGITVQNLKADYNLLKQKIARLNDGYLDGTFEHREYKEIKNPLTLEKKDLEEKISNFERQGNHRLELVKNWILEANQAKNLALRENFEQIKIFLKAVGLNRRLTAGKMEMEFKKPWDSLAKINANAGAESTGEATNCVMWEKWGSNCWSRKYLKLANKFYYPD